MDYICQCLLLIFFTLNAYTDIKKKKISVFVSGTFFIAGVVMAILSKNHSLISILGGVGVGGVLLLTGKVTRQAVGFGDGIIFFVTGIYLGFIKNIALLFYGLVICAIVSIIFLATHKIKMKDKIPFAPFVLISFITMLIMEV